MIDFFVVCSFELRINPKRPRAPATQRPHLSTSWTPVIEILLYHVLQKTHNLCYWLKPWKWRQLCSSKTLSIYPQVHIMLQPIKPTPASSRPQESQSNVLQMFKHQNCANKLLMQTKYKIPVPFLLPTLSWTANGSFTENNVFTGGRDRIQTKPL